MTALPEVLPLVGLEGITLKHGSHSSREDGVCLLEAVAWVAGEPHSDHPSCACPVMAAFGRRLNDRIRGDVDRTSLLRPVVTLLVGSKSTLFVERKRAYLAADWAIREITPQWLELRSDLKPHADGLRALAPIVNEATAQIALKATRKARDAADAAYAAAYAYAYAADAAYAAYAAADAKPIITALIAQQRQSAVDFLRRMAAITE